MTDGKDTAAKTKPLISKENAQNRPETIQRGQVLGVSAFRDQIGKDCTSPYSYTFPYCSNNVPCKKSLFLYSLLENLYALLTKAKISDRPYFSDMGGELRKGHCGGNYV